MSVASALFEHIRGDRGVLGLGGGPLGNYGQAIDDGRAAETIEAAWNRGIRYFDTAPHYGLGLSERRLGASLADLPRDEVLVSTKVGRLIVPNPRPRRWDDDGFMVGGNLMRRWDFSLDGVRRSLSESLERLGLDRVDLLLAHDPDQASSDAAREGLASLAALKAEGLVSAIGIGTNSTDGLAELIAGGEVDVVMLANRYSLLDQTGLDSVLEPARLADVAIIAVGVFGTGLLSTSRPDPSATYDYQPARREIVERAARIAAICEGHGVELPAAALAFPLLHPAVSAVAVGMRSVTEVDDDVRRFEATIPDALWRDLVSERLIPQHAVGQPG